MKDEHECKDGEWWREYDAQGIYLCRVCDDCQAEKLSRYRPEILTGYTQADVDEPIEEYQEHCRSALLEFAEIWPDQGDDHE